VVNEVPGVIESFAMSTPKLLWKLLQPAWGSNQRPQFSGAIGHVSDSRKASWSNVLIDDVQRDDLVLRMMDSTVSPVARCRINSAIVPSRSTLVFPMVLHLPEEQVVVWRV
jgi:hypothetical protein